MIHKKYELKYNETFFGTYLIDCHESPEKNADFLVERNHIYWIRQVC